jgi:flavin reductase (DIM6/NTAB) family NADH-FMN oxidoreductase RutF
MHDEIQRALASIPYGVSVVTVGLGGDENGLTVSWLTQCAARPPMLCFSIHRHHHSLSLLDGHPHFVVNLLRAGQTELATRFARTALQQESKLDGLEVLAAPSEVPRLANALAWFDCAVRHRLEVGEHVLVVGEVTASGLLAEGAPMTSAEGLRYRG